MGVEGFERLWRKAMTPSCWSPGPVAGLGERFCRCSAAESLCSPGELVREVVTKQNSLMLPRMVVLGRRSAGRRSTKYNRDPPRA